GKKAHIAFGAFWGLLSILHGLQHAGKLEHDAKELIGQTAHRAADKAEQISLHAFLAGTDIASYLPGRIRVYNLALAGNAKLADQVSSFVRSFSGVTDAKVALNTGSLLITYEPDELRKNPHLANIETFVREHAKIR
ncbi:MAG: hypothetical protein MSB07_08975, partial [Mitsuokella jalaludinii]|nr:hypothetical protein [Mitsuokella jalaludinii]